MYVARMRAVPGLIIVACIQVACGGLREPTKESPLVAVPAPSASLAYTGSPPENAATAPYVPVEAAPSAIAVAPTAPSSASVLSRPTPYPEEWIRQARGDNTGLSCLELVYKNGCSQTRTGIVTFEVTIDDTGAVEKFSEVDNQIRNDKALVSRCLKNNLLQWKFHPPEGFLNTFQLSVALADRC